MAVLGLALGAYASAILAKVLVNLFALRSVEGGGRLVLGIYYGLQTSLLEVGFAYLFAAFAVKRIRLTSSDSTSYGISLAFWENGVLLGALSILNLGIVYALIADNSAAASLIYSSIQSSSPSYFLPPSSLLPSELLGTLERLSSILAHAAWGVLCMVAAVAGRKRLLAVALPMGMVDALVPYADFNLDVFEAVVFLLSVGFVLVARHEVIDRAGSIESENQSPSINGTNLLRPWMIRFRSLYPNSSHEKIKSD